MKYLVTGGNGFIGKHIAQTLLDAKHTVTLLDNLANSSTPPIHHPNCNFIKGDIRNPETVQAAAHSVEGIFHLAAQVSVPESFQDPSSCLDINIRGTLNVLEAARNNNARMVFSSTCAVYGDSIDLPCTESTTPSPLSPYAYSKLVAENFCSNYAAQYKLNITALRYYNVYGPGQPSNSPYSGVIAKLADAAINNKTFTLFGDGQQSRDFIHVSDIVSANILAMKHANQFQLYNCSTNSSISLLKLIESTQAAFNKQINIHYEAPRTGDINHSSGSSTKLQKNLNWVPKISIESGIKTLSE